MYSFLDWLGNYYNLRANLISAKTQKNTRIVVPPAFFAFHLHPAAVFFQEPFADG